MSVRYSWTQPLCWNCWDAQHPEREPVRVRDAEQERCVICGDETTGGIYIRIDPATAPFPSKVKD